MNRQPPVSVHDRAFGGVMRVSLLALTCLGVLPATGCGADHRAFGQEAIASGGSQTGGMPGAPTVSGGSAQALGGQGVSGGAPSGQGGTGGLAGGGSAFGGAILNGGSAGGQELAAGGSNAAGGQAASLGGAASSGGTAGLGSGGLSGVGGAQSTGGGIGCQVKRWYFDADSDGFGDPNVFGDACQAPPGPEWTLIGGDCNDANAYLHPGLWYRDNDGDTYGDPAGSVDSCTQPLGTWVRRAGDCNDSSALINPGAGLMSTAIGGSYDFDCDGTETPALTRPVWEKDCVYRPPAGPAARGCDGGGVKLLQRTIQAGQNEQCGGSIIGCTGIFDDYGSTCTNVLQGAMPCR